MVFNEVWRCEPGYKMPSSLRQMNVGTVIMMMMMMMALNNLMRVGASETLRTFRNIFPPGFSFSFFKNSNILIFVPGI